MVGPRGIPGIPGERGEQVTRCTCPPFFIHTVYLSSLNVSLCFCIRVRLALMDIKGTEENQA